MLHFSRNLHVLTCSQHRLLKIKQLQWHLINLTAPGTSALISTVTPQHNYNLAHSLCVGLVHVRMDFFFPPLVTQERLGPVQLHKFVSVYTWTDLQQHNGSN